MPFLVSTVKEEISSDVAAGIMSMTKVPMLDYFPAQMSNSRKSCHHEGKGGKGDGSAGEGSCCTSLETRVQYPEPHKGRIKKKTDSIRLPLKVHTGSTAHALTHTHHASAHVNTNLKEGDDELPESSTDSFS